ncbi:MAG: ribosomal subunit interface protein [Candidatus Sungbacteria bacterium RIFCSPLOWO2_12_FULL_41_11]|uniref:Ribosomal subunit interface protein n=1 Tax=Candidatus Sungbacteria bacterium RIFCSPLOWO2_12_FULL_41_11 TaxID=1802286 RepID=A0A1G2LM13_9BACT|nr:MAG: Sigma 54 modulation protein / S30EA ribosomal protein [Parcubacteria group bacterium GW2011_GWA2_42_14]OHA12677.1 MAG: ribosomal subunit interface protein [Candidatus Sungbacteria bacterium RIFCSPLOWO2_12_FULL_41_11]
MNKSYISKPVCKPVCLLVINYTVILKISMKFNLKTTGFSIDAPLRVYVDLKIVRIVAKLLKDENLVKPASLDIEIERETRHHQKGRIWRAEVNLVLPKVFLRAEAEAEDIRSAIDMVQAELSAELRKYKEKRADKNRRRQRIVMEELKVDPLARIKRRR